MSLVSVRATAAHGLPSSGAIKRARLEKAEPTITYEAFVEDLDRGDSFTTSLIDVLVKVCLAREPVRVLDQRRHTGGRRTPLSPPRR